MSHTISKFRLVIFRKKLRPIKRIKKLSITKDTTKSFIIVTAGKKFVSIQKKVPKETKQTKITRKERKKERMT